MNTIRFQKNNVLVTAHRGVSGLERENTCAAFVAAGNRSYYGIECDIWRTADGRFAVTHDRSLKRVSGEDLDVEKVSLATAQSVVLYDMDDSKNRADLRVPAVEDYIRICKRYEKQCILELKSSFTEEELQRLVDVIRGYDYLERVTFISFDFENLRKLRVLVPEQSVQFLTDALTDEVIAKAAAAGMDLDVYYRCLSRERIEAIHRAGIKVNCWTVDDPAEAEQLVDWGVDQITSNILE